MSVSSNYGQMQVQVATELGYRTDLLVAPIISIPGALPTPTLSPIQNAIQNAIAKYERKHFYFNEYQGINSYSTSAGQEFYSSTSTPKAWSFASTGVHVDKIWVTISNNRYSLNPRTEQYISDTSLNPSVQGQPIDYAYYNETFRLYPIPDGTYPITIEGVQRLSALVNPADTNAWMQDAEALIRTEAKVDLLVNYLKQSDLANEQRRLIHGDQGGDVGYLNALMRETVGRMATPKIRASYF